MIDGFLVHHISTIQEIIAVFDKNESLIDIFFQRKNALNLGEVVKAKIIAFNKLLKGYFALATDKNLSVFIPSNETYVLGETVCVEITKEARFGKDATGVFTDKEVFLPNLKKVVLEKYPFEFKNNFSLSSYIEEALDTTISFENGAELSVERTNAVWAIDVDSGKSTSSLFEINQKSISYIKRQIQLKNIAGMILIDFAGFKSVKEKAILLKDIKNAFKDDSRTKIYDFTKMNLLEIKRARTSASLFDVCYTKEGFKTFEYVCLCIKEMLLATRFGKPVLEMHPAYARLLPDEIKNYVQIKQNLNVQLDFFDLREE